MAKRILYTVKVKPTGFLARWRWARVVIDDHTYVITQEDVPGEESINENCLSDYNRVSSPYAPGAQVTEWFNQATNQKITVYAADCSPFAQAVVISQSPPTPPTPPPNPFGTATYGLFKYFQFCDIDAREVLVEIEKKEFVGVATEIERGDQVALTKSKKPLSELTDAFHITEYIFGFIAETEGEFDSLSSEDERMFRVTVTYLDTGEIDFKGFFIPQYASEPFLSVPYPVTIRATDGLGALKKITYPIPAGGKTNMRQTWLSILQYAFSMTNIELPFFTLDNLYEVKMPNTLDDDPWNLSTVNPLRQSDEKGNIMSCYDVILKFCDQFTSYVTQDQGYWKIVRIPELANPVVRIRRYHADGSFMFSEQIGNSLTVGLDNADVRLLGDANIERHNAYKRVVTLQKFGFVPSIIFNGDFADGDNTSIPYWTNFGVNYSRVQNTISGVNGQPVLIDDYSLQFNQRYDLAKWFQPSDIRVQQGDKVSLSFNLGSNSPATVADYMAMRIVVSNTDGSAVWLKQAYQQDQNGMPTAYPVWDPALNTIELPLGKGPKVLQSFIYTVDLPVSPIDGNLTLQFFGFVKRTGQIINLQDQEYTYSPMQIDNVKVAITNTNNNAIPDGVFYVSEQQAFYTQSPDVKELLYGDNVNLVQNTNVTVAPNILLRNNISSIFTVDGSYSTKWYEYGLSSTQLPIANWAAKGMLKLYQRPFRLFNCSLRGYFSTVNVFEICNLPDIPFAFQSGDFDVKNKQWNRVVLTQIFANNILTNDFGGPHNPGQAVPPYIQNANLPVTVVGTRIFTDEFTEQFT